MDIIIGLSSTTLWHMKSYLESVIFLVLSQIIEPLFLKKKTTPF